MQNATEYVALLAPPIVASYVYVQFGSPPTFIPGDTLPTLVFGIGLVMIVALSLYFGLLLSEYVPQIGGEKTTEDDSANQ